MFFSHLTVSLQKQILNIMGDDVFKSISQRIDGTYDEENRRIKEISDELQKLCRLYETQLRDGKENVNCYEIEQRAAESYAKSVGMWIPMSNIFDLGVPGPSGNENDTYVSPSSVFKVNNLLNSKSISGLLNKILLHNTIFPNTAYRLHGFAGYDGRSVLPVLEQERICNAQPATQIMIDTYMSAIGFIKMEKIGHYSNDIYEVWDILPRNVLVDSEGDIYVIDAEIKKI